MTSDDGWEGRGGNPRPPTQRETSECSAPSLPTPRDVPPAGLSAAGLALWRVVTAEYALDERETHVLALACAQADVLAALEAAVVADGAMVAGSAGQPRLHPAVAEARQARIAVARLLGQLALPTAEGRPTTARGQQARAAARARWARRIGGED